MKHNLEKIANAVISAGKLPAAMLGTVAVAIASTAGPIYIGQRLHLEISSYRTVEADDVSVGEAYGFRSFASVRFSEELDKAVFSIGDGRDEIVTESPCNREILAVVRYDAENCTSRHLVRELMTSEELQEAQEDLDEVCGYLALNCVGLCDDWQRVRLEERRSAIPRADDVYRGE